MLGNGQKTDSWKSPQNVENTRKNQDMKGYTRYEKNTIHLPRQYFPKTLKPLNLSYVLDSEGTFY